MITVEDHINEKYTELPVARREYMIKALREYTERKDKNSNLKFGGFPEFSSSYMAGNYVDSLVYQMIKPGQIVIMYTPGDDRFHMKKYIIEKKKTSNITLNKETVGKRSMVHMISPTDKNDTALASPNYVVPTEWKPKVEGMDVEVNDLVCIKERQYRPGYDAKTIFKIVRSGQKYVRLEPLTPKWEIDSEGGYNPNGKNPGDGVFQYNGKERISKKTGNMVKTGWKKNCYNMDIPKHVLVNPKDLDHDAEALDLTKELLTMGF